MGYVCMKNLKRILCFGIYFFIFTINFYAQNDNISLPDLTTVVQGENNKDVAPSPDFSNSVTLPEAEIKMEIDLPDEYTLERDDIITKTVTNDKIFLIDGTLGGGYPSAFLGEFKIASLERESPFNLNFKYNSSSGFASKDLISGFNQRDTSIKLNKTFLTDIGSFTTRLNLEDYSNGLQNQVEDVYSINQDYLGAYISYMHSNYVKKIFYRGELPVNFYFRYSHADDSILDSSNWNIYSSVFDSSVKSSFLKIFENGSLSVRGTYSLFLDGRKNLSDNFLNRGLVDINSVIYLSKKGKYSISLNTNAGVVGGDNLNNNFLIPFSVGLDVKNTENPELLKLNVKGGLKTEYESVADLEKKYKFSSMSSMGSETSDWYCTLKISTKYKGFNLILESEYDQTAYNNGIWQPVYDDSNFVNGIYTYEQKNRETLANQINAGYSKSILDGKYSLDFALAYKLILFDLGPLDYANSYYGSVNITQKDSKWGLQTSVQGPLFEKDCTPKLTINTYLQLSPNMYLHANMDDVLKLITREPRTYAGKYIQEGGSIMLLLKFLYN